jgi:NAD(P)H-dependent flavin oxidoreductase YrpB (nitropropane dioxygenase family)
MVDAVKVPVIAAGGIADGWGIAAAFALGAPAFPHAATALAPLRQAAEKLGKPDFTNLWAGQAVGLGRDIPAAELSRLAS